MSKFLIIPTILYTMVGCGLSHKDTCVGSVVPNVAEPLRSKA
jgi:hypothetical protein